MKIHFKIIEVGKYLHSISTLSCIVFVNSIRRAAGNSILANAANYKCSKCVMTQRNSKLQISGALKRPLSSKFFNMKNFYKARAILLFTMDYFFQLFQWRYLLLYSKKYYTSAKSFFKLLLLTFVILRQESRKIHTVYTLCYTRLLHYLIFILV